MSVMYLLYGYIGHGLLWLVVLRTLLAPVELRIIKNTTTRARIVWLLLLTAPALALAYFSLGMLSYLSVTFVLFVLMNNLGYVAATGKKMIPTWVLVFAVFVGALLYASALGFIPVDLYAWGFYPRELAVAVIVTTLLLWRSAPKAAWGLASALGAFSLIVFGWQIAPSRNLWDYLIDPVLVFSAVGMLFARMIRRIRGTG